MSERMVGIEGHRSSVSRKKRAKMPHKQIPDCAKAFFVTDASHREYVRQGGDGKLLFKFPYPDFPRDVETLTGWRRVFAGRVGLHGWHVESDAMWEKLLMAPAKGKAHESAFKEYDATVWQILAWEDYMETKGKR